MEDEDFPRKSRSPPASPAHCHIPVPLQLLLIGLHQDLHDLQVLQLAEAVITVELDLSTEATKKQVLFYLIDTCSR